MIKLIMVDDELQMGRITADIIRDLVITKPNCTFGLATGATPLNTYKYMIEDFNNFNLSYKDVKTFNLDEYVGLDKNDKNSYHYYMKTNLFNYIDIKEENIHIPCGISDLSATCEKYHKDIENNTIDLQILGLGTNGHIGFNEPGVSLESTVHVVDLDEQTILDNMKYFNSFEQVPIKAVTMGISDIMSAKSIVLLVNSIGKLDALKRVLKGPITSECPASVLRNHADLTIVTLKNIIQNVTINLTY